MSDDPGGPVPPRAGRRAGRRPGSGGVLTAGAVALGLAAAPAAVALAAEPALAGGDGGVAVERARDLYNGVGGDPSRGRGERRAGFERAVGGRAYVFGRSEVEGLIARGWRAEPRPDHFRGHGERVRTLVELATRLGHGPRVGAMQAVFGTPQENDVAGLQAALAEARARHAAGDPRAAAEIERLAAELPAAAEAARAGHGSDDAWATVDLDANGDGTVDARDLEALDGGATAGRTARDAPAAG